MNYLTETTLGVFLQNTFPNNWVHDKIVPNSNIKNRPDYRCDELKMIVEFDGYLHYTSMKSILNDYKKDEVYKQMGYKIIRIPYFVQLESRTIKMLFGLDINFEHQYQYYVAGILPRM